MSSVTAQESSETQPSNPVNKDTTSAPGTGTDPSIPFGTSKTSDSGFDAGPSSKADKVRPLDFMFSIFVTVLLSLPLPLSDALSNHDPYL